MRSGERAREQERGRERSGQTRLVSKGEVWREVERAQGWRTRGDNG